MGIAWRFPLILLGGAFLFGFFSRLLKTDLNGQLWIPIWTVASLVLAWFWQRWATERKTQP